MQWQCIPKTRCCFNKGTLRRSLSEECIDHPGDYGWVSPCRQFGMVIKTLVCQGKYFKFLIFEIGSQWRNLMTGEI